MLDVTFCTLTARATNSTKEFNKAILQLIELKY